MKAVLEQFQVTRDAVQDLVLIRPKRQNGTRAAGDLGVACIVNHVSGNTCLVGGLFDRFKFTVVEHLEADFFLTARQPAFDVMGVGNPRFQERFNRGVADLGGRLAFAHLQTLIYHANQFHLPPDRSVGGSGCGQSMKKRT